MIRQPPRATRTDTLLPATTRVRSRVWTGVGPPGRGGITKRGGSAEGQEFGVEGKECGEAPVEGGAARRNDGADPRHRRTAVFEARLPRRDADGCREAGRRPSLFAQILFRRPEDAVRRRFREPSGGDARSADAGNRRLSPTNDE